MRVVYIAHPISGHIENNLKSVAGIARYITITEADTIPFAPYYFSCKFLRDDDSKERQIGIRNNEHFFKLGIIDELRLYGDRISNGMWAEIKLANELGIKIKCMNVEIEEDYKRNIESFVMSFNKHEVHLITIALRYIYGKKLDSVTRDDCNISEHQKKQIIKKANEYDDLATKIDEL